MKSSQTLRPLLSACGLVLCAYVLGLAVSACNFLAEGDPENANLILRATQPGDQVVLIVSSDFDVDAVAGQGQSNVFLRNADTLLVTPPFEQEFSLGQRLRFFASVSPPDSTAQVIDLRVLIDGDQRFSRSRIVEQSMPMEFLYLFAQPII